MGSRDPSLDDRPAREIEDLRERAERAERERDQAQCEHDRLQRENDRVRPLDPKTHRAEERPGRHRGGGESKGDDVSIHGNTESIYRRYAIVDATALREAAEKIDRSALLSNVSGKDAGKENANA